MSDPWVKPSNETRSAAIILLDVSDATITPLRAVGGSIWNESQNQFVTAGTRATEREWS